MLFGITILDVLICWGILSFLIFCLFIWPMCVAAARADEAMGLK